jgi:hypothetical protein
MVTLTRLNVTLYAHWPSCSVLVRSWRNTTLHITLTRAENYVIHVTLKNSLKKAELDRNIFSTYVNVLTHKQQFAVTPHNPSNWHSALPDNWVTNKCCGHKRSCCSLQLRTMVTCLLVRLSVCLSRICRVLSVCCKTVSVGYGRLLFCGSTLVMAQFCTADGTKCNADRSETVERQLLLQTALTVCLWWFGCDTESGF